MAFKQTSNNETGTPVAQGFEYNSGDNPHFLNIEEILGLNHLSEAS
jgi:UDP-N-acetylglucosamine 4,6-dehydratase/5-epimerase